MVIFWLLKMNHTKSINIGYCQYLVNIQYVGFRLEIFSQKHTLIRLTH